MGVFKRWGWSGRNYFVVIPLETIGLKPVKKPSLRFPLYDLIPNSVTFSGSLSKLEFGMFSFLLAGWSRWPVLFEIAPWGSVKENQTFVWAVLDNLWMGKSFLTLVILPKFQMRSGKSMERWFIVTTTTMFTIAIRVMDPAWWVNWIGCIPGGYRQNLNIPHFLFLAFNGYLT